MDDGRAIVPAAHGGVAKPLPASPLAHGGAAKSLPASPLAHGGAPKPLPASPLAHGGAPKPLPASPPAHVPRYRATADCRLPTANCRALYGGPFVAASPTAHIDENDANDTRHKYIE